MQSRCATDAIAADVPGRRPAKKSPAALLMEELGQRAMRISGADELRRFENLDRFKIAALRGFARLSVGDHDGEQ